MLFYCSGLLDPVSQKSEGVIIRMKVDIKTILKNHGVTVCAALSLIACLLPFYKLSVESSYIDLSETYNLFQALGEDFSFRGVLFLLTPALLIAMYYLLHFPKRKFILFAIPLVSLLNALTEWIVSTGTIAVDDWFWDTWYAKLKPSVGFFIAMLTYVGSIVMVIWHERGSAPVSAPAAEPAAGAPTMSALVAKGAEIAKSAANVLKSNDDVQEKREIRIRIAEKQKQLDSMYLDYAKNNADQVSGKTAAYDAEAGMQAICQVRDEIAQLEDRIVQIDKKIINERIVSEKLQAMQQFDAEIAKLDKALTMEVMTQAEYDEKRAVLQRRVDNFEAVKRIEIQQEMGVISREEKEQKIAKLFEE